MDQFRWPNNQQRTLIVGKTGSGKSVFAAHVLSNAPFTRQPYIVIDYKTEELFNSIDRARHIDYKEIPKRPGLYILHARPDIDDEAMNDYLWKVSNKGRIGLVYDEGYMLPSKGALNTIYTQGRSKRIPVITLTQRPVWLTRFAFSEADFIAYLHLNDREDQNTLKRFVPPNDVWDLKRRLPDYHSRWYDVAKDASFELLPAPSPDDILQKFDDRLRPARHIF